MMNNYLFETCPGPSKWNKLLRKVCILLVFLTYVYHEARSRECKAQGVLRLSAIFSSTLFSAVPEVIVEGRVSLKDLCQFCSSSDMSSSSDVILCPLIQVCTNPGLQVAMATKFCRWRPLFSGSQYGLCFKSPFWHLEFWGGSYIFPKSVHPYSNMLSIFKLLWMSKFPFMVQYCDT